MKQRKYIIISLLIIIFIVAIVCLAIMSNAENIEVSAKEIEDERTMVKISASHSIGKSINQKVEKDTFEEELEKYAGNGKTSVTEEASDTLLVTFISTGNEYEINTNTGQLSLESEGILGELPSTEYTTPYLPHGFLGVAGTDLNTGLVIKDGDGNQYVWVEVPRTSTVYPNAGLNITNFTVTEYTSIETDLKTYTNLYRNGTAFKDDYYSDETTGLTREEYYNLKNKMLKSVYQNGGFYVGRYETGIESTPRYSHTNPTETPVIKEDVYLYNYVSTSEAQALSGEMESGEYTSSLMFGVQWDLILKYLETKAVEKGTQESTIQNELTTDSTSWGNYLNSTWNITKTNMKYLEYDPDTQWLSEWRLNSYDEKGTNTCVVLSPGASNQFRKQNIYDLAGNIVECTLETTNWSDYSCLHRGGFSFVEGYTRSVRDRASATKEPQGGFVGFRVCIF